MVVCGPSTVCVCVVPARQVFKQDYIFTFVIISIYVEEEV